MTDVQGLGVGRKARGPHYDKRLKTEFVKNAPPGRHTDGGGLYLEVTQTGSRHWLLRIVVKGRRRDLGLGSTSVLSLADARLKAHEFRQIARTGGDPTIRKTEPKSVPFRALAAEVHRTHIMSTSRNGKHVNQWLNTLAIYAFPTIGDLGVNDITRNDIITLMTPIWITKQEIARRVLQRLHVVFEWAIVKGHRPQGNPVDGARLALPRQRQAVKNFAAIPWEETPALMQQLEQAAGIGAVALRFTILTALRSGPVRKATWDQFSPGLDRWTIPAENMKGDRVFEVPLPLAATDILRGLEKRRSGASPYVFASPRKPKQPISENTMAKVLHRFYPDATVHGMRSAFRDWAEIFAEARDKVKEYALSHINQNKTESAYLRTIYWNEREELMEVWGLWAMGAGGTYADLLNQFRTERFTEVNDTGSA